MLCEADGLRVRFKALFVPRMGSQGTPAVHEIYYLPLDDDGAPGVLGGYIYLPPPSEPAYTLRFAIEGTSSICREGSLWTNIPRHGEKFRRHSFHEYK